MCRRELRLPLLSVALIAAGCRPPAPAEEGKGPRRTEPVPTIEPTPADPQDPHAAASPSERSPSDIDVVARWFEALVGGDVAGALAVSGVPFSLDRQRVVMTKAELKATYEEVVESKGARDLEPDTIVSMDLSERSPAYLGDDDVRNFLIHVEDERILVFLREADGLVVGFTD